MDEEELPTIVIDNGSANIRAGLARDMDPKTIFPAVVGQSKGQVLVSIFRNDNIKCYV